jgi:hypothetical protein
MCTRRHRSRLEMHEAVQEATGHRNVRASQKAVKKPSEKGFLGTHSVGYRAGDHHTQPSAGARKLANFASAEFGLVRLAGRSHLWGGLITFNTNITHLGDAENVGEDDIGFVGNTASKEERRDNRTVGRR